MGHRPACVHVHRRPPPAPPLRGSQRLQALAGSERAPHLGRLLPRHPGAEHRVRDEPVLAQPASELVELVLHMAVHLDQGRCGREEVAEQRVAVRHLAIRAGEKVQRRRPATDGRDLHLGARVR
mgnify:CR=1 FL=1